MANVKKYNKPLKKNITMEQEDLFFIQDYAFINGISDTDFINAAIKEKIHKIKKQLNG